MHLNKNNRAMSDCDVKKRKLAQSAAVAEEEQAQKAVSDDPDGQFLRQFIGPQLYDGEYRMDGKMNWTRYWSSRKLPQCEEDLAAFVVLMAERHQEYHPGSYELQLLLTAINSHTRQAELAAEIKALLSASKVGTKMRALINDALDHFTTYVVFDRNNGSPRPRLRYQSFKNKD